MASKVKEGANGKERRSPSPSTPENNHTPSGRRTPRSSGTSSPGRDNSSPSEKSTPRYLKPTASSSSEPNKLRKKPTSISVTANSLTRKKSLEKPPSPTPSQTQRTPTLASPRDRPLKPSFPSPKTATSPKPVSDKTSKTLRNGRVQQQPLKATRTLKRETSLKKIETKASPSANGHDIGEKLMNPPEEQEDKAVDEMTLEMLKADGEEQYINEIQPIDYVDVELDISENSSKYEASETSSLSEELKDFAAEVEGNKKDEEKELVRSKEPEDGKLPQQLEENTATTDTHNQFNVEKEEAHKDGKVRIHEGKVCGEKESELAKKESLKVKEKDAGIIEELKAELVEKKAPRRQDSHGKKESQAYNDVIEETASKLVEKRKSRVKALVGAFETVISLQDPEGKVVNKSQGQGGQ